MPDDPALIAEYVAPPPCPRCGEPCFKVPVPTHPGDDAWIWGHDCWPEHSDGDIGAGPLAGASE